jgi:proteasome lid subunit RPN8/RPN11
MGEPLLVTAPASAALAAEASRAHPAECCGLVGGRDGRIEAVFPVANIAERPESRYEMAPAEMWSARRLAASSSLDVLGFYHSHPRTVPFPSSYDVERAYYPDAVYLIVGLAPRFAVRAFAIANKRVREIELRVET